jgi:hypothetical protein
MKYLFFYILLISTLFLCPDLSGQDTSKNITNYPAGIFVEYGYGNFAVKDQYISNEKYSGKMPMYKFGWARVHEKYVYKLEFAYRFSNQIKNNNASTDISQVTLNQGFLYPLRPAFLFKKQLYVYLGPSTDFIYYFNDQHIAVCGFDYASSFAAMLSLGLNTDAIYLLSKKFQVESSLDFSFLSFTVRSVDPEVDDQSPAKLLGLIKGINGSFDLGIRYFIIEKLSVNMAYEFQLLNVNAWDPATTASDNGIIGITYRF